MNITIRKNRRSSRQLSGIAGSILAAVLLAAITLTSFWPVLGGGFIMLDDNRYITRNDQVRDGLTLRGLAWAFTTTTVSNWHPLTWLSHMLDVKLFGLDPWGHHLVNLLWHTVNTILLFIVLRRMTGALWRSSAVAVLFAIHPLHVESVAWVAERKDVLSTFFWFLTILLYLRFVEKRGWRRYLAALSAFILGIISKPMVVTLPFVLLLMDYWPLGRLGADREGPRASRSETATAMRNWIPLAVEKVPFFLLAAILAAVTYWAQRAGGMVMSGEKYPFTMRLGNAPVSYLRYLWKMVYPLHLAIPYPHPARYWLSWQTLGAVLFLACLTYLAVREARRRPWLLTGWLFFLGTLIPVIGLVQIADQSIADRYTYIPLTGVFMAIVWWISEAASRSRATKAVAALLVIVLVAGLGVLSRRQAGYWRDDLTLFGHAMEVTEDNFLAIYNVGAAHSAAMDYDKAMPFFAQALRIYPKFPYAQSSIAYIYLQKGQLDEAIHHYEEAIKLFPDFSQAHLGLGVAFHRQGRFEEAAEQYIETLALAPNRPQEILAHTNLGDALLRLGKVRESYFHLAEAKRLGRQPSPERGL